MFTALNVVLVFLAAGAGDNVPAATPPPSLAGTAAQLSPELQSLIAATYSDDYTTWHSAVCDLKEMAWCRTCRSRADPTLAGRHAGVRRRRLRP